MHYSEDFAQACFEAAAAPMRLRAVASQPRGEHDFDIVDPDGNTVGLLEVTCAIDSLHTKTVDAVFNPKRGGERVPRVQCQYDWGVHLNGDVRVDRLRRDLDAYLARVEADGVSAFDDCHLFAAPESVIAICEELDVAFGHVLTTSLPGAHWLSAPGVGAMSSAEAVNRVVRAEAAKCDNIRKLTSSSVSLRHLFVCVDSSLIGAWMALTGQNVAEPVKVDSAMTHLWAAALSDSRGGAAVWHARNGEPWTSQHYDITDSKWYSLVTEQALPADGGMLGQ